MHPDRISKSYGDPDEMAAVYGNPDEMGALYGEMLRRQRMEEEFMAGQGAFSGAPGAPVPTSQLPTPSDQLTNPTLQAVPPPEPPRPRISQWDDIIRPHAGEFADDERFIRTAAAAARAESTDNPQAYQLGYKANDPRTHAMFGGRGLWQFDINKGAKGHGIPEEQLFDPSFQASVIVPEFAQNYRQVVGEINAGKRKPMSDDQLASYVAGMTERPENWDVPTSAARKNYARAYNELLADLRKG